MNRVKTWVNSVLERCNYVYDCKLKKFAENLIDEFHIENISDLYCINVANNIIRKYEEKSDIKKAELFFATLWSASKCLWPKHFLIGLGFDKDLVNKIFNAGYDTIEKMVKVNYEDLVNIGVEEKEAKNFVEQMIYMSDEINFLLDNRMIIGWGNL